MGVTKQEQLIAGSLNVTFFLMKERIRKITKIKKRIKIIYIVPNLIKKDALSIIIYVIYIMNMEI